MLPYAKIEKLVLALQMILELDEEEYVSHAQHIAKNVLKITGEGK